MLKAIKIRIYPNNEQEIYISKLLGTCRFVYNHLLSYKINEYNDNKHAVSFGESGKKLVELKNEFEWIKEVHSKVLQQSLINLESAYKSFFKNGNGFPKFKSKHNSSNSCRFPSDGIRGLKGNRINIIKQLSNIHFKCSKNDEIYLNKNQHLIKSGTLSKNKSGQYYFSILIDKPITKVLPITNNIVGIDIGIKDFIIGSNGINFENIKVIRNNEKKLKKLHQNLSKKVNGSNNKNKTRIKLAKVNNKLNNIKNNYLHHIVNQLLNENQVIVIEDLSVKSMMNNHNLAKSIQELSINKFTNILKYKAEWYNKDIIQVDKFFSSTKLCSCCNYKNNNLTLNDREWTCPTCKTHHDRDFNASMNLLNEGKRILNIKIPSSSGKLTLQESTSLDNSANEENNDYYALL